MKAVVYDSPGSFTITEIPTPEPKPGEVRVRVKQTGICGTDLHIHNGKFFAEFPLTPGHELVGPVDALGDGARPIFRTPVSAARAEVFGIKSQPSGSGANTWANSCVGVGNRNCRRMLLCAGVKRVACTAPPNCVRRSISP